MHPTMEGKRTTRARWILHALLILSSFGSFSDGAGEPPKPVTMEELKTYVGNTKPELTCYVCNSLVDEHCHEKATLETHKKKCKDEYFQMVYGKGELNLTKEFNPNNWPRSISELAKAGADAKDVGWTPASYDSAWKHGMSLVKDGEDTNRFSSLANAHLDGSLNMAQGFQSCQTMTISVVNHLNEGKRGEIPKTHPLVIRGCSFVNAASKDMDVTFENRCRTFNYKSASTQVCYCMGNNCNGSTHLLASQWILMAASVLALLLAKTM